MLSPKERILLFYFLILQPKYIYKQVYRDINMFLFPLPCYYRRVVNVLATW